VPPRRQSQPRSPEHAALGLVIQERREELELSQEQLADASGLHVTHVGGLERGIRNSSYATLIKLASALRTTPGTLLIAAEKRRR
jgi:transcriptional regulator with XRE-family HTH domain